MNQLRKTSLLLQLLATRPVEFYDRVLNRIDVAIDRILATRHFYEARDFELAVRLLEEHSSKSPQEWLAEESLSHIEDYVSRRACSPSGPFTTAHNADLTLARLAYLVCRAWQPRVVVETGVAYGVTSAFILQALDRNGKGALVSIDLPPLGDDVASHVGSLVPEGLRNRWSVHRGPSKRLLPKVLAELKRVDVFLHDSLHTRRNIQMELNLAWRFLAPGGVLLADDVSDNDAFATFCRQTEPPVHAVVAEQNKDSRFGLAIKRK
ncbi:MAG: class I SAM-dependent methyltransferase [Verrucomicrobiales bacterium]|nr:class I SAM-dependent methyltransferase [Verrucomicrobiales bacterium]